MRTRSPRRLLKSRLALIACMTLSIVACDEQPAVEQRASTTTAARAASPPPPAEPITVSDDLDRRVTLEAPPRRIATTASFVVEYLLALDVTPVLRPDDDSADASASEWSDEAQSIPALAVSHSVGPNMEQLAAAQPDLVVTTPTFARFVSPIEQALNVPTLVYEMADIHDVPRLAERVGALVGKAESGKALAQSLREQIEAVQPIAEGDRPTVFALFGTPAAFFAFRPQSYLGSMIEALGGQLITSAGDGEGVTASRQLTPFSLEVLVAADPDVILLVHHGPAGEMASALRQRAAWADLAAVRHGRVHRISQHRYFTSPGLDLAASMRELRALLAEGASP